MTVTLGVLMALWFLLWGIMAFTGRGRFGNAVLGILAILIGAVSLFGSFGVTAR